MGYAVFAARKIMLTDQINQLGLEQLQLTQERMKLTRASSAISDGEISAEDYASLQNLGLAADFDLGKQKASKYTDPNYYAGLWKAEKTARENVGLSWEANIGGAALGTIAGAALAMIPGVNLAVGTLALIGGIGGAIIGNQCSAKTQERNKQVNDYKDSYDEQNMEDYINDLNTKIAEMENMLDMKQQKLDTELQVYNSELEQVKNAEKQGIKNATPNYAGQ